MECKHGIVVLVAVFVVVSVGQSQVQTVWPLWDVRYKNNAIGADDGIVALVSAKEGNDNYVYGCGDCF